MAKRSPYQERVIQNYYRNRDAIMLQRLGELVSELYLAEPGARKRLWKRAAAAMEKLAVPKSRIEHIINGDDPSLLANLIKELMDRKP